MPNRDHQGALNINSAQLGMWLFLATVTMLFAGFTSAYLVRQTTGSDWQSIPIPSALKLNTLVLILSSVTLEIGRFGHRRRRAGALRGWLLVTTLLGVGFLSGQWLAWLQLKGYGLYLPSNPHSSFFYILTGLHGVHLAGGIVALFTMLWKARRSGTEARLENSLKLCASYWHFMGALWLHLFLVLFIL